MLTPLEVPNLVPNLAATKALAWSGFCVSDSKKDVLRREKNEICSLATSESKNWEPQYPTASQHKRQSYPVASQKNSVND